MGDGVAVPVTVGLALGDGLAVGVAGGLVEVAVAVRLGVSVPMGVLVIVGDAVGLLKRSGVSVAVKV